MPILGAHQSIAGGYYKSAERARTVGCDCVQLFTKNNNQWRAKELTDGDVERALIAVQQSARREQLQREVVRSSRLAFEISETRLREGAVDLVTVLNTQQALFQADDAAVQARLARLQAIVSLFQALGGGWPLPPNRSAYRH